MMALSKSERKDRERRCMDYLRRAGSLPAAQALARKEGYFGANTSVWIEALGKMLKGVKP